ncbi:hypothetical protein [Dokdonella koreensis]|uniref:hypothetical protein n=1 Tax=Dokdonella koreensis TaxID=323415 RepID=UPI0012376F32|nr:hypothetical protein [Dokdonella koreensis]
MTHKYQQSEFPLKPVDRGGRTLHVGCEARIIAIPDVDFDGFDAVGRTRYVALEGRILPVVDLDENGYAIFHLFYSEPADMMGSIRAPRDASEFYIQEFCFDPRDVERV